MEINNVFDRLIRRWNTPKKRISELEDMLIEIVQTELERENE